MKSERQNRIIELISHMEIETQDEMIARLRADGFDVTQATISRDMRELKLTKVQTGKGSYKYVVSQTARETNQTRLNHAVVDAILSVDYAMNTVVLKTCPGMGMAVASGVDSLHLQDILGCVGGDDTIIAVTRDEESAARISQTIRDLMKSL